MSQYYVRKTDHRAKWAYSPEQLRRMAIMAAETSIHQAAVKLGVQWATVRKACDVADVKPGRARPCPAKAKARAIQLRRQKQLSYGVIARKVGYSAQLVGNWCRDAGIDLDCRYVGEGIRTVARPLGRPLRLAR
jgi:hypothetical protein